MDATIVTLVRDIVVTSAIAASALPILRGAPESVALNELVASNDTTLVDEDGDSSDWIELHNDQSTSASLEGWHLTDDPLNLTKWTFPAVDLPGDGYLVVFASDKDRAVAGSELHTNFKLSSGGEYLALVRPGGLTVAAEFSPNFTPLSADQSYGRPFDTDAPAILSTPTPGSLNSGRALPSVQFEPEPSIFDSSLGPLDLELTPSFGLQPGEALHFTVDGTEPDGLSPIYIDTIPITATTRVRARVVRGAELGPLAQSAYTEASGSVLTTASTLPLVVVDTLGAPVSTDEVLMTPSIATVIERNGPSTVITDPSDYSGFAGMRIRGSSSSEFPKKQYKLELWEDIDDDLGVDLLGMGVESDWVLYAPGRYDRAIINNPLMYELSAQLGLPTMETRFCELYLNDNGGPLSSSDYDGIYILTESIKISPERIDLADLKLTDITEPEVTGGYIISIDRVDAGEHNWVMDSLFPTINTFDLSFMNIARPKLVDLVPEHITWVEDHFEAFDDALYGPDFADPALGYRAFIDTASWIDQHIVRLIGLDPDFLWLSNFFYKDKNALIHNGPVWDMDRSLDSDDWRDDNPTHIGFQRDPFAWEWWGRLSEDPAYRQEYCARWFDMRSSVLSNANIHALIDQFHAEIASAYPQEDARWGGTPGYGPRSVPSQGVCEFDCDFTGDFQGEIDHLKNWIDVRLGFLDSFFRLYDRTNVAAGRTATQISVNDTGFPGTPELAVDDDNQGHLPQGQSCTKTNPENQAWWEVDLGSVQDISHVRIWNRTDCCSEKLANVHILLSDVPFVSTDLATAQAQPGVTDFPINGTARTLEDTLTGRTARYIRVQLQFFGVLSLAEVEAFAGTNLALGGIATQSSTDGIAVASNVNDGDTNGQLTAFSVGLTQVESEPWWEVDLGDSFDIESLRIWNRTDPCCSTSLANFHVFVSDLPFASTDLATTQLDPAVQDFPFSGVAGETELFNLVSAQTTGRYVRIQAEAEQSLGLAEVQIYQKP